MFHRSQTALGTCALVVGAVLLTALAAGAGPAVAAVDGKEADRKDTNGNAANDTTANDKDANDKDAALRQAIVAAEDGRARTAGELAPILEGTRSSSPAVQQVAVRALGRLETPSLVPQIVPLLSAASPLIRAEAANALAQAFQATRPNAKIDVAPALGPLKSRLAAEQDPQVRGVIFGSLGRLPYADVAVIADVERSLAAGLAEDGAAALGASKGLESLLRIHRKTAPAQPETIARLRQAATAKRRPGTEAAQARRLALGALIAAGAADAPTLRAALADDDPQVRRIAAVGAGSDDALTRNGWTPAPEAIVAVDRAALIRTALADRAPMVRYDALHAYATHRRQTSCAPIVAATKDENAHVALLAIDLLGGVCPDADKPTVVATLRRLAEGMPAGTSRPGRRIEWHRASHALTSLAQADKASASALLPKHAAHPVWQVRMYAARAAATLASAETLDTLAADTDDNVVATAIAGLARVRSHAADKVYVAALERPAHHVIRAAARALAGTPNAGDAVPALFAALRRLTATRLDNTRDPRVGIVERLKEIGTKAHAAELMPYLADFDPRIATMAAETLQHWTGTPHEAAPVRERHAPPALAELAGLETARVRIAINGGVIEARLFPSDAPATVARFVRLVRSGYYNGLTFHRVVPNWVIQGGSPGANELAGHSPFMKDEVGRRHVRGALGISTRGHDTGDAQFFVDLADNIRLDHGYTVFGEVTRGLEVVDGVLEGDVMTAVEIVPAPGTRLSPDR